MSNLGQENYDRLEAQSQKIMSHFADAGFERIAPGIIQPADIFLDVVGESIRGRTYVFTDPDGAELCLRPDLTVPVCRLYLERHPSCDARSRYCYNGPAFRFQPGGATDHHPREFRQAGIEFFGDGDHERAEAEVVALTQKILNDLGLKETRLRMGDLGLFKALLEAIEMPERWRAQLAHDFWRRDSLSQRLKKLTAAPEDRDMAIPEALLERLDPEDPGSARGAVAEFLEKAEIPMIGARTLDEISSNLLAHAEDARHGPLPAEAAELIEAYVAVEAPPKAVGARIGDLMNERNIDLSAALETYKRRLTMFDEAGVDMTHAQFCAEFGRNLEYYSGFVFQIELLGDEEIGHIAGGGRYDTLLKAVGAPHDVAGIGVAIHTERLLVATESLGDDE